MPNGIKFVVNRQTNLALIEPTKHLNEGVVYTEGIPRRLDTDVRSVVTVKTSRAL